MNLCLFSMFFFVLFFLSSHFYFIACLLFCFAESPIRSTLRFFFFRYFFFRELSFSCLVWSFSPNAFSTCHCYVCDFLFFHLPVYECVYVCVYLFLFSTRLPQSVRIFFFYFKLCICFATLIYLFSFSPRFVFHLSKYSYLCKNHPKCVEAAFFFSFTQSFILCVFFFFFFEVLQRVSLFRYIIFNLFFFSFLHFVYH